MPRSKRKMLGSGKTRISIVRETVVIRVWRRAAEGRFVNLSLRFEATDADVTIARRGSDALRRAEHPSSDGDKACVRCTPNPPQPRRGGPAAENGGRLAQQRTRRPVWPSFSTRHNPEYPGEWIKYPALPWFQPTFPTAMTRFVLKKGQPLELRYRLWIRRGGTLSDRVYGRQWQACQEAIGCLPARSAAFPSPSGK